MFNSSFYPTPKEVGRKMLLPYAREFRDGYYLGASRVLEPSAGKGDLVDLMVQEFNIRPSRVSTIELEPELRAILYSKGYNVIDSDFLEFSDPFDFDLIVMNPPFNQGARHLLKAWDILRCGKIVCLLNSETLRNPYTAERKRLLEIVKLYGRTEELGQAFSTSERSAMVYVTIVWLEKEEERTARPDFSSLDTDEKFGEHEFSSNLPASRDIIASLVAQYNRARDLIVQRHKLTAEIEFYVRGIRNASTDEEKARTLNEEIAELKKDFWKYVFDQTRIGAVTTSNFQKDFWSTFDRTKDIAFSIRNVSEVLQGFIDNRLDYLYDCIYEVFKKATRHHHDNTTGAGWKTNKSWKLNNKIIVPDSVSFDYSWRRNRYNSDFLHDLDKVCNFVTGTHSNHVSIWDAIDKKFERIRDGEWYQEKFASTHFLIRIYKKGTVHLWFREQSTVDMLNQKAAEGRGYMIGKGD